MTDCKPLSLPLVQHTKFDDEGPLYHDPSFYRQLIDKLLYLTITRPDLSFLVQALSQFMQSPTQTYFQAAQRLLRYIKVTAGQGILFSAESQLKLTAFCDSDWGTCPITGKSITGFCVLLGDSLVSWQAKKQSVVSRSTAEAEYRAFATTV